MSNWRNEFDTAEARYHEDQYREYMYRISFGEEEEPRKVTCPCCGWGYTVDDDGDETERVCGACLEWAEHDPAVQEMWIEECIAENPKWFKRGDPEWDVAEHMRDDVSNLIEMIKRRRITRDV